MPPSPLTVTTRYTTPGIRKIYWVTTMANYLSPSRIELNAGIDLTNEIAEMTGFTVSSDTQDVPDMSSRFVAKIPGRINADDSSIRFYASQSSADVRTVLPRDTAGYVVTLWEGDVAGQKMDVWPAKVTATSVQTAMEDPASVEVGFSITRVPAQNVTIP
jgi:hypothetical protein